MKKETLILIILAVIIVVLTAVVLWPTNNSQKKSTTTSAQTTAEAIKSDIPQQVLGIQVNSPTLSQQVSSPINISGVVNNGGWSGFEGQVGIVQLLDSKGNKIASGVLKAVTDWTKPPVQFTSTITVPVTTKGSATLLFSNENASGDPSKDRKFGLPIVIK